MTLMMLRLTRTARRIPMMTLMTLTMVARTVMTTVLTMNLARTMMPLRMKRMMRGLNLGVRSSNSLRRRVCLRRVMTMMMRIRFCWVT